MESEQAFQTRRKNSNKDSPNISYQLASQLAQKFTPSRTSANQEKKIQNLLQDLETLEKYCSDILTGKIRTTKNNIIYLHTLLINSHNPKLRKRHHALAFQLHQKSKTLKALHPFSASFYDVATEENLLKLQAYIDEIENYWKTISETIKNKKAEDQNLLNNDNFLPTYIKENILQRLKQYHTLKSSLEFFEKIISPLIEIKAGKKGIYTHFKNFKTVKIFLEKQSSKEEIKKYSIWRNLQLTLLAHYKNFNNIKKYIMSTPEWQAQKEVDGEDKYLRVLIELTINYYYTNPKTGKLENPNSIVSFEDANSYEFIRDKLPSSKSYENLSLLASDESPSVSAIICEEKSEGKKIEQTETALIFDISPTNFSL